MALKKRIHCVSDHEPPLYHDTMAFAVNMNIECEDDDAGSGSTARDAFGQFLEAISVVEFHAYELRETGADWEAHRITMLRPKGDTPRSGKEEIVQWLDNFDLTVDKSFWLIAPDTAELQDQPDKAIETVQLKATHLLRGSHAWSAPIAHNFGLTRLLAADGIDPSAAKLLVLPHCPGQLPTAPLQANRFDGDRWEVTYTLDANIGEIVCRSNQLKLQTALPEFLTGDGYLKVNPRAANLRRFLEAFERGWTGVVSALPTVLVRSLPQDGPEWVVTQPDPSKPATATFESNTAVWRVIAGLTTALDPTIIALLRPGSEGGDRAIGDVLLPLVSDILDAAADMPPSMLELTATQVTQAIRDILRLSPLLKTSSTSKEFIDALRTVHGLSRVGESTDAAARLLDILLNTITEGQPQTVAWEEVKALAKSFTEVNGVKTATGFAQDPYEVVTAVTHRLHEEAGAEKAILRLFASAAVDKTVPDLLWERLRPENAPAEDDLAKFRVALVAAWNGFGARLEGPFNGEEAIRRSAGADFLDALLQAAHAAGQDPLEPDGLLGLLQAADLYVMRILESGVGIFKPITDALPKTMLTLLGAMPQDVKDLLASEYKKSLSPLERLTFAQAAFIAEAMPAPLPIQVSAMLGAKDLENFSMDFNGICVALRRLDLPDTPEKNSWCHANLAKLSWEHGAHKGHGPGLRQWLPAAQDSRAPMFIDYEGFPFGSRTIGRVKASNADAQAGMPFYECDELDYDHVSWKPVPRLVYGRTFEAFSFATTNSGSIPLAMQQDGDHTWLPDSSFATPPEAAVFKMPYSRRTSIGAVTIGEPPGTNRLGVAITGVNPLSADYPRIALAASKGCKAAVDLLREPDGSGVLAFPEGGDDFHVDFADFTWTGKRATVRVLFFDQAALVGVEAPAMIEFRDFDPQNLMAQPGMTVSLAAGASEFRVRLGNKSEKTLLQAQSRVHWWIRVELECEDPVNIAFADPCPRSHAQGSKSLLLMAPSKAGWKDGLSRDLNVQVAAPRIGFLDFDRWFGNRDLLENTFGNKPGDGENLMDALLVAYVRRDEPLGPKVSISSMLDRLPDPAVEALRVELVGVDTLNDTAAAVPKPLVIDLQKRMMRWADKCTVVVENIRLADLQKVFEELEKLFSFDVDISSNDAVLTLTEGANGHWKANVPEGVVAELRVSSIVPKTHFESANKHPCVIHGGVKEAAVLDGNNYVFPGDTILIETMIDRLRKIDAVDLAQRVVSCRPQPLVREYSLVSNGDIRNSADRRDWKLVSEVAVVTQRWRMGGRPVYNMIEPGTYADGVQKGPAVPFKSTGQMGSEVRDLENFEKEIFLGRDGEEAETIWKTLDPQMPASGHTAAAAAAAITVLQSISWEAPSATYFRHRFQVRSRYSGALSSSSSGTVEAWTSNDEWTRRVAMLADRNRVLVTRPQLRALMPLTTSPHLGGTPPIIGYMQEPPCSEGGLADRVAAEIKLGFGYGFAPSEPGKISQIGILDARKEFGPDPRLDYRRIRDADALAIGLDTEGPVGLTFDPLKSGVPAFANSIISMAPAASTVARYRSTRSTSWA